MCEHEGFVQQASIPSRFGLHLELCTRRDRAREECGIVRLLSDGPMPNICQTTAFAEAWQKTGRLRASRGM